MQKVKADVVPGFAVSDSVLDAIVTCRQVGPGVVVAAAGIDDQYWYAPAY
ncbi:MAG: hypothetical protein ABIH36_03390 [bacterium]